MRILCFGKPEPWLLTMLLLISEKLQNLRVKSDPPWLLARIVWTDLRGFLLALGND
jgi:hypothetical protein